MKKSILLVLLVLTIMLLAGCPEQDYNHNQPLTGDHDVLVVYFSWSSSNNTQTMAEYIQDATDSEILELIPTTPYTTNYNDVLDVAQSEKNSNARPAISNNPTDEQLANYDVIFIGYPIWWYDAPMIIYTFVESHNFEGQTIIPFATSGGTGITSSNRTIREKLPQATVLDGLQLSGSNIKSNQNRVNEWINSLGLSK